MAGVGIQPSELAKIAIILFTAAVLERRMDRIDEPAYAVGPIVVALVPVLGLIMWQPDFGSSLVLLAIVAVMVFAAGLPWRYIVKAGVVIVPVVAVVAILDRYRVRRLTAFLDPWADRLGDGYQLVQSLIAVGSGGVTGKGLGYSVQKLGYLPYPHTDFIYAVVGEELGLVGASLLLVCFCLITWRGLRTASRAPDAFGSLARPRPHHDDRGAGVRQHERGAGPAADQGHHAAVRQRRRLVAHREPGRHGRAAEHLAARLGHAIEEAWCSAARSACTSSA